MRRDFLYELVIELKKNKLDYTSIDVTMQFIEDIL